MSIDTSEPDLLWGAHSIRKYLGLETDAQVFGLIKSGHITVMRVGRRICASRRTLNERFEIKQESASEMASR